MKLKTLSIWIKAVLLGFAVCGAGILGFAVPSIAKSLVAAYPEFASAYIPWTIFLWIAAVPCLSDDWNHHSLPVPLSLGSFMDSNIRVSS